MKNKRPTLSDPEEYAIIKQIYFPKDNREEADDQERYERQEARQRNFNNNSR